MANKALLAPMDQLVRLAPRDRLDLRGELATQDQMDQPETKDHLGRPDMMGRQETRASKVQLELMASKDQLAA